MRLNKKVPFYSNTNDDTHCFQAALRMILKYFQPDKEYSWEELDKISAKVKDLWTWPIATILWLQENGFKVIDMEIFDWDEFADGGRAYLIEFYGKEGAEREEKHSNIDQEIKLAKELTRKFKAIKKIPSVGDIKKVLKEGFLPICLVNSRKLNKKEGYTGHLVVVKGFNNEKLIIHDPGLPPIENRIVSNQLFENAWAYPSDKAKNLIAIRLRSNNEN